MVGALGGRRRKVVVADVTVPRATRWFEVGRPAADFGGSLAAEDCGGCLDGARAAG